MAVKCSNCGGSHPKWDCTKPRKESAAPRKDVVADVVQRVSDQNRPSAPKRTKAGTQPLPVEMPSSGSRSLSKDIEEPALRKGHEVSRGAERKEQHPTPKPKIGRPRTGFDKKEYNRKFTADLRTIKRLGLSVTVAQYRKSKET